MLKAALEEHTKSNKASATATSPAASPAPATDNRSTAAPQANEGGRLLQRDLKRRESFITHNVHVLKPTFQIKGTAPC